MHGTFNHVAQVSSLEEIGSAIERPEINLSYAPLPVSSEAQDYIDSLVLGENGEFSHITYAKEQSNISRHRDLALLKQVTSRDQLEPDILLAQMTNLPDRPGKFGFAVALSMGLKTFWDAQKSVRPIKASLMEKEPCENPQIHLDGMENGRNMRGLVTFTGGCATRFMDNEEAQIFEGGDFGYKPVLGFVSDLEKTTEIRTIPIGALSIHKGLIMKTVPNLEIGPNKVITVTHPLVFQNPLGHAEASTKDCNGKTRLQFMIDQVPSTPSI